ncbi:MAG: major capsid protein [Microviridae sp.]|nr:MAG: major capsid protein [Microviridae sp.]
MKRTKHSLSHYKLLTCDMGKLVPIGLVEALPGDTIQAATSLLLRFTPQLSPVMHPISVRIHHYFVPNRLVFGTTNGWSDFITGGADGLGNGAVYPTNSGTVVVAQGDPLDYLGVPPASYAAGKLGLMALRAYNMIFNEYYRDEDLVSVVAQDTNTLQNVAWEKDYFTSSRPWTQKGPAVTLPLGTSAPVKTSSASQVTGAQQAMKLRKASDGSLAAADNILAVNTSAQVYGTSVAGSGTGLGPAYPENLFADLTGATATDVNAVRRAFALMRYQEARARYGSRYTEYLRYLGITPSDARLDRPEYLGGGKQTVSFSEVLRTGNVTADDATLPIGQLKGHGIAAMRSNRYRYFCEEHGYIMSLLSVRPRSMYVNGLDRTWSRRTKEDYYQKELERIGQQAVLNKELFWQNGAADDNTFGYQDRYSEYRHQYSSIAGNFRTTLNYWHLARIFGSLPTLNQAFTDCAPGKRVFADQTATHSCWIMASHNIQARRLVGPVGVGRVI